MAFRDTLPSARKKQAVPPGQPVRKEAEKKPPESDKATVTRKCGHTDTVDVPPAQKPEHREAWLAKLQGKLCKACNEVEQQRVVEEARARKAVKKAKKRKPDPSRLRFRLPDQSEFCSLRYTADDESTGSWYGELTVPVKDGPSLAFSGQSPSVHQLLDLLGRMWFRAAYPHATIPEEEDRPETKVEPPKQL